MRAALRCDGHALEPSSGVTNIGYAAHKNGSATGKKQFSVFPTIDFFELHFIAGRKLVDGNVFDGLVVHVKFVSAEEEMAEPVVAHPAPVGSLTYGHPPPQCPAMPPGRLVLFMEPPTLPKAWPDHSLPVPL